MAALVSPNWSYKCEALGFKHGRPHYLQVHWTLTIYNYYFLYIPSYHCGITIGIIICNSISCILSIRPKLWFTKDVRNRHCVTGVTGTLTQPSCLGHLSPVTCHLSPGACHQSHVTCHLSPVTCHMSTVICHLFHITNSHTQRPPLANFLWGGGRSAPPPGLLVTKSRSKVAKNG